MCGPNSAADPGLVFDSNFGDWLGFLCGTQLPTSFCTSAGVPVLDPSNLNTPSIAIGDLAGVQTVTRRVTNVGGNPATYTPSVNGLAGFSVSVTPASLTLAAGETKSFTMAFTRTTATLNTFTGGQLRLSDGTHTVRVPVVVRPVALAAPAQVSGPYNVTFGYSGPFTATARGLIPSAVTPGTVTQDPDQTFSPTDPTGTVAITVPIPAGTTYARFSLFNGDVAAGSDIDMYVTNSAGTLVGVSGSGGSDEEVNLVNPAAGTYTVYIHGWGLPTGTSPFRLHAWLLGSAAAGNMTVTAPASATIGQSGAITVTTQRPDHGREVPRLGGLRRRHRHAQPDHRARRSVERRTKIPRLQTPRPARGVFHGGLHTRKSPAAGGCARSRGHQTHAPLRRLT